MNVESVSRKEGREIFRRACAAIGHTPESFLGGIEDGSIDVDDPEMHGRYVSTYMLLPFWRECPTPPS